LYREVLTQPIEENKKRNNKKMTYGDLILKDSILSIMPSKKLCYKFIVLTHNTLIDEGQELI
jgi:hypothetical protein